MTLGIKVGPDKQSFVHRLDNPSLDTDQDVWILVEPNGRHAENYFLAQKILAEALIN